MYDSYGDGWNGASVDVTVNGIPVVTAATGANMGGLGNSGPCEVNFFLLHQEMLLLFQIGYQELGTLKYLGILRM